MKGDTIWQIMEEIGTDGIELKIIEQKSTMSLA